MFSKKNIFLLVVWLVYCAISFLAVYFHEPNHDEAEYWVVARDMNFVELMRFCSFSGHPCVWFSLLMPFAKMGFPFFTASVLHWLLMAMASAALVFKAPFHPVFKILFLFSYYMIYHYVADLRDYNLTIALLFLIASIYPFRFEKKILFGILVFLLFNSNIHSLGAAFALTVIYFFDAVRVHKIKQAAIPLCIMAAGLGFLIFQLFPSGDIPLNTTIYHHLIPPMNIHSIWTILVSVQNAFIPISPAYEELKVALLFFLFFLLLLVAVSDRKPVLFFLCVAFLWCFYLFAAKFPGEWRHQGLLLVFIIFSLWIYSFYAPSRTYFFRQGIITLPIFRSTIFLFTGSCLFISVLFGFRIVHKEISGAFSGAKEAGQFIAANINEDEIACYTSFRATAVAPYVPDIKLWFIDRREYGTYYLLDTVFSKYAESLSEEEILSRCEEKYGSGGSCLLLVNLPLSKSAEIKYSAELYCLPVSLQKLSAYTHA